MNANIEIKELSKLDLAYVTHIGVERLENAFNTIYRIIGFGKNDIGRKCSAFINRKRL